jgi:uncharacterized protein (TIGR02001 family)
VRPGTHGLCLLAIALALGPGVSRALTFDADLGYTSDYIHRGVSESAGHSAAEIDLRVATADGTFAGVFASTLGRVRTGWSRHGWDYKLEEYLGHQFDLSAAWTTTLTAANYSYRGGNVAGSNDYQELSLAVSYLDLWTVTLAGIPNAVRWNGAYIDGRYPAFSADTSLQIPIYRRLFLVGGMGYYTSDDTGYLYGNVGLAMEIRSVRVEGGYFAAQDRARSLFSYARAGSRYAVTALWHF